MRNNSALHGAGISILSSNRAVLIDKCELYYNKGSDPNNLDSMPSTGGGIYTLNSSMVQIHKTSSVDNSAVRGGGLFLEQHATVIVKP